jgi:uncharacterized protein YlxW (UPF0749 family)
MRNVRGQALIATICLVLGVMLVTQFRSQKQARGDLSASSTDQATYISQLYDSNTQLRQQVSQLTQDVGQYKDDGKSNLDAMVRDLQNLRMANGEVEVSGPGVSVLVEGDLTVFELQDLVNELRNASAEAVAVNGIRVVTRSSLTTDQDGGTLLDRQPVTAPYRLDAIGSPDTLAPALQRKGGLIALLQADNARLKITVTRHEVSDKAHWLSLPRTALQFDWTYAQPASH